MSTTTTGLSPGDLRPTWERSQVVAEPPDPVPGAWIGAPALWRTDSGLVLASRLRRPVDAGRGYANVVSRVLPDGRLETLAQVGKAAFGAESLERPAVVVTPDGTWRLYVSVATPGTKHWRVDLLEAATAQELSAATPRTVLPGDAEVGVKDPVVLRHGGRWHLWATCHPLDRPGHEDRMTTRYAVSDDGVAWSWRGTVLGPGPGRWDSRGTRLTAVLPDGDRVLATYDGRASAEENWEERTGVAVAPIGPDGEIGAFTVVATDPAGSPFAGGGLRYVSAVREAAGIRLYYEATRADGAHHLRTELVTPA